MRDLDQNHLRRWLSSSLEKRGRGARRDLAEFLGLSPGKITRMANVEPGKEVRDIQLHEMPRIIEFFGEAPSGWTRPSTTQELHQVLPGFTTGVVIGKAEAGAFREASDLNQEEAPRIQVPEDSRFPNARVLIFEASGDSMNALQRQPILEGSLLVCVSYEDIAHEYPLRTGMVVVVERTRDGGHLREWSVKQVELGEERIEFHPRSTNPRHEPIVIDRDPHADTGTNVQIIALVRRVMTDI